MPIFVPTGIGSLAAAAGKQSLELVRTYGPYRGRDGRARVVHYYRTEAGARTTTESYPRYVWRMNRGEIPPGFQVDHKDGDLTNDQLDNLQLLPPSGNSRKAYRDDPELAQRVAAGLRGWYRARKAADPHWRPSSIWTYRRQAKG